MKQVTIFTDGSCIKNGAPDACGGYAAILTYGSHRKEIYGGDVGTTNNRMELTAVIRAIEQLTAPCEVIIASDSAYVGRTIEKLNSYQESGWLYVSGKPVANSDLVQLLYNAKKKGNHVFKFQYIKAHSGNPENERCDTLAQTQARALQKVQVIK